ncbi:MAG: hypothetical protein MK137_07080, partial [Rickettsiales bacterium]|nr:hypothetical protein [Rickettsiales bacterium]
MTNARDLILFFIITFLILTAWSVFVENPRQAQQKNLEALNALDNDAGITPPQEGESNKSSSGEMVISDLVPREHIVTDPSVKRVTIDTPR